MELKISRSDDSTEPIGEWMEAGDMASTRCVATGRYAMCFIIFPPMLHLRCMSLLLIVLDVIPKILVGAEMVTEVASRLLHFLVGAMLSTTTTTAVCSTWGTSALLVTFSPLIGVMLASLVDIASFALISGAMRLIVPVVALVKIGTTLLPGTSLSMTSGGGSRWSGCMPLVDLDCDHLQISLDGVECRGFREFI
jgi:hypothetical protein